MKHLLAVDANRNKMKKLNIEPMDYLQVSKLHIFIQIKEWLPFYIFSDFRSVIQSDKYVRWYGASTPKNPKFEHEFVG